MAWPRSSLLPEKSDGPSTAQTEAPRRRSYLYSYEKTLRGDMQKAVQTAVDEQKNQDLSGHVLNTAETTPLIDAKASGGQAACKVVRTLFPDLDTANRKDILELWLQKKHRAGLLWNGMTAVAFGVEDGMSFVDAKAMNRQERTNIGKNRSKTDRNQAHIRITTDPNFSDGYQDFEQSRMHRDTLAHMMGFAQVYYLAGLNDHPVCQFDLKSDIRHARGERNRSEILRQREGLLSAHGRPPSDPILGHAAGFPMLINTGRDNQPWVRGELVDRRQLSTQAVAGSLQTTEGWIDFKAMGAMASRIMAITPGQEYCLIGRLTPRAGQEELILFSANPRTLPEQKPLTKKRPSEVAR